MQLIESYLSHHGGRPRSLRHLQQIPERPPRNPQEMWQMQKDFVLLGQLPDERLANAQENLSQAGSCTHIWYYCSDATHARL